RHGDQAARSSSNRRPRAGAAVPAPPCAAATNRFGSRSGPQTTGRAAASSKVLGASELCSRPEAVGLNASSDSLRRPGMNEGSEQPKRVLVWGAGGHGRVVAETVEASGHAFAGFIDRDPAGTVLMPRHRDLAIVSEAELQVILDEAGALPAE